MSENEADKRPGPSEQELIAEQREHLRWLQAQLDDVRELRDRECELEVECIAAESALKSADARSEGLPPASKAAAIASARERVAGLRAALGLDVTPRKRRAPARPAAETERLEVGRQALAMWLEAPRDDSPRKVQKVSHAVLLVVTVAAVAAAATVHPVFLVIPVALALPLAFLSLSGQDRIWVRLGAQRRFRHTGLRSPERWEREAVGSRLSELEVELETVRAQVQQAEQEAKPTSVPLPDDPETVVLELSEAEADLSAAYAAAGCDPGEAGPELENWLNVVANASQARLALEEVSRRRVAAAAEAEAGREALHRFLSRRGVAPPAGQADVAALARGLERLEAGEGDAGDPG